MPLPEFPREIALNGVFMPTLTAIFMLALLLGWLLDRGVAALGLYRYVWHPALLRFSLFVCLFVALSSPVYYR